MSNEFHNKISDQATMSKKGNMFYWDDIDNLTEEYVRQLIVYSTKRVSIYEDDDDTIIDLGNRITEFATNLLTEEISAEFPYIDENY